MLKMPLLYEDLKQKTQSPVYVIVRVNLKTCCYLDGLATEVS